MKTQCKKNPVIAFPITLLAGSHSEVATGHMIHDAKSFYWETSKPRVPQCPHSQENRDFKILK